jgi:L-asparaginase/Glu-tRNA(Gln) amidotransferase subunit D
VGAHVRRPTVPFSCDPRFDSRVEVVWTFPGIRPDAVARRLDHGDLRGVVIAALGVGTVPDNGLSRVVRRAVDAGVVALVTTQWGGQVDLGAYRNSHALQDAGAIDGGEMRIEAAVPKLMHALATRDDPDELRAWLREDVAGERG